MQFSGKITNSILAYLARFGWDRERLFEVTDIPLEYLRDPTSWIAAADVEAFLGKVEAEFHNKGENILLGAGHASSEIRGWGVLDSVLRMMQKPQDIFAQPHRFISYFVSPAPPIANLISTDEMVTFDLPISHQEYPCTVAYLSAALEGLPKFWGQECAHVRWHNTNVRVSWSDAQSRLLTAAPDNHKPELVESLVRGVEMAQAQVEARDLEIARLEHELQELKIKAARANQPSQSDAVESLGARTGPNKGSGDLPHDQRSRLQSQLDEVRENVLRLADYLTRSQQALTLARIAHRQDPQVQAVLRRIDWETIRTQYPWVHLQIMEGLNSAEQILNVREPAAAVVRAGKVNVQDILDNVVAKLEASEPSRLKVRPKSFIEGPVAIDADRAYVSLWQVLSAAAREMKYRGEVTILARLDGDHVEVVIGERGHPNPQETDELPLFRGEVETPGSRQFVCRWPVLEH